MREIKFRAWHTVKGKMYSWEYIKNTYTIHALSDENVVQLKFMQYTGLKDKNGVEIYEGDIVDILHPAWSERMKVIFDRGSFTLHQITPVHGNNTLVRMSAIELWEESNNWKMEVISNIYENPELLERL